MTLFGYRLGIRIFTLLGLFSLLTFIFGLDPGSLRPGGFVFFFASLWLVISGLFSLLFLFLYEKAIGVAGTTVFMGSLFRQALLLGSFVLSLILLRYFHVFVWWNATLLFIFFVLLEFTFRRFSSSPQSAE